MSMTINTKAFTADIPAGPNAQPYFGPANTLAVVDRVDLQRTYPKPTSTFSGVGRSRYKQSRTVTLTGALTTTGLATMDININIPVGMASADVDTLLADAASFLGLQAAKDLAKSLDLTN